MPSPQEIANRADSKRVRAKQRAERELAVMAEIELAQKYFLSGGAWSHARALREYERIRREAWSAGSRVSSWCGVVS
jgi:hypothetical protein